MAPNEHFERLCANFLEPLSMWVSPPRRNCATTAPPAGVHQELRYVRMGPIASTQFRQPGGETVPVETLAQVALFCNALGEIHPAT